MFNTIFCCFFLFLMIMFSLLTGCVFLFVAFFVLIFHHKTFRSFLIIFFKFFVFCDFSKKNYFKLCNKVSIFLRNIIFIFFFILQFTTLTLFLLSFKNNSQEMHIFIINLNSQRTIFFINKKQNKRNKRFHTKNIININFWNKVFILILILFYFW